MLRSQGRRGEVAAALHTGFPERFAERRHLSALAPDGRRRELELEGFRLHKGGVVLKFAGVECISDAEALAGYEVQVPREQRVRLQGGEQFVDDLIGCEVYDSERLVGKIADVQFGAGEAPLLVVKAAAGKAGQEYLLPFAEAFVKGFDPQARRLEMALPAGLLELDAPLTAEEKREQQSGQARRAERE